MLSANVPAIHLDCHPVEWLDPETRCCVFEVWMHIVVIYLYTRCMASTTFFLLITPSGANHWGCLFGWTRRFGILFPFWLTEKNCACSLSWCLATYIRVCVCFVLRVYCHSEPLVDHNRIGFQRNLCSPAAADGRYAQISTIESNGTCRYCQTVRQASHAVS